MRALLDAFAASPRYVADYLLEEVLRWQPESVRTFLLHTCVLDRLSAPLCEAVANLHQGEGQAMLHHLERANVFTVAMDSQGVWFRYHQLFANYLAAHLSRTDQELVPELHRRAAQWYVNQGLADAAIGHALAAGEFELTASLAERNAVRLLKHGEYATLLAWLRPLPEGVVRNRPWLRLYHASALLVSGQLDEVEAQLRDCERFAVKVDGSANDEERADAQRILAAVLNIRAAVANCQGDHPTAVRLSNQAAEHALQDDEKLGVLLGHVRLHLAAAYWQSGDRIKAGETIAEVRSVSKASSNSFDSIWALCFDATLTAIQGQLHEAEKTARQAHSLAHHDKEQPAILAVMPCIVLARLRYEWNNLEAASRYAEEAIAMAHLGQFTPFLIRSFAIMAWIKRALSNVDRAFDLLEQAARVGRENGFTQEVARIAECEARLRLMQGDVNGAYRWAQKFQSYSDESLSYLRDAERLTLARVLIVKGHPSESLRLLDQLLAAAQTAGRVACVIQVLTLRAEALQALGQTESALDSLGRSLSLAEPEGFVRTFVDAGAPLVTLLSKLLRSVSQCRTTNTTSTRYVASCLLAAFDRQTRPSIQKPGDRPAERASSVLSEREREILSLLTAGWSRDRLAQELIVSRNTVNTHISSIYHKLDAHNRMEALARAKDLHLLE